MYWLLPNEFINVFDFSTPKLYSIFSAAWVLCIPVRNGTDLTETLVHLIMSGHYCILPYPSPTKALPSLLMVSLHCALSLWVVVRLFSSPPTIPGLPITNHESWSFNSGVFIRLSGFLLTFLSLMFNSQCYHYLDSNTENTLKNIFQHSITNFFHCNWNLICLIFIRLQTGL